MNHSHPSGCYSAVSALFVGVLLWGCVDPGPSSPDDENPHACRSASSCGELPTTCGVNGFGLYVCPVDGEWVQPEYPVCSEDAPYGWLRMDRPDPDNYTPGTYVFDLTVAEAVPGRWTFTYGTQELELEYDFDAAAAFVLPLAGDSVRAEETACDAGGGEGGFDSFWRLFGPNDLLLLEGGAFDCWADADAVLALVDEPSGGPCTWPEELPGHCCGSNTPLKIEYAGPPAQVFDSPVSTTVERDGARWMLRAYARNGECSPSASDCGGTRGGSVRARLQ